MSLPIVNYGSLLLSNLGIRKAIEARDSTQRQQLANGVGCGFLAGYAQAPAILSWEKIKTAEKQGVLHPNSDFKTVKVFLEQQWPNIQREMPAYRCKTGLKGSVVGTVLFAAAEIYKKYF